MPVFTLSCAVFLFYLLGLPTTYFSMFADPDTLWHLAAGDQIRALGHVPAHDLWSFTAGDTPWYNIAWLWDILISHLYAYNGWHALVALNSITMAAMLALTFANSLLASRNGCSAFFATLIFASCLCNMNVRPYQASMMFIAALLLFMRLWHDRRIAPRNLCALPLVMVLWVNIHGGFIAAFVILGIYGLAELYKRERARFLQLFATGIACLLTCMVNPWGIRIVAGVLDTLDSPLSYQAVLEWHPPAFVISNVLVFTFPILLVLLHLKNRPRLTPDVIIGALWFIASCRSFRHFYIFGISATPLLANGLHATKANNKPIIHAPVIARLYARAIALTADKRAAVASFALCIAASLAIFTPTAAQLYGTTAFNPLPNLAPEVNYLLTTRPDARLLNSFNMGGALIFMGHGRLHIWMDGRINTAYPSSVTDDYIRYWRGDPSWLQILQKYQMDTAIIINTNESLIAEFSTLPGWKQLFRGDMATIYGRKQPFD